MKTPLTPKTRGAATVLIDAECKMVAIGAPPYIGNDLAEIARRVNAFDALVAACAKIVEAERAANDELNFQYLCEATDLACAALALVKEAQCTGS